MNHKKATSILVLTILLGLLIYYINNNLSEFKQVRPAYWSLIIPLVFIFLIIIALTGILNNALTSAVGLKISQKESFALSIITGFYNLITPFRGGMAARALYLKKKYNFAYVHFLSTLSAVYILVFLISSAIGLISLWRLYTHTKVFSPVILLIFTATFCGMFSIILFSPTIRERNNKWINKVITIINGWNSIKRNKRVIITTSIITLAQLSLSSLMFYLQFLAFRVNISFTAAVFLSVITSLSIIVAITPGNIGIQEAITVFSAATIGITPAQSLAAALLGRLVSIIVLFILGPIFSYTLLRDVDEQV